MTPTITFRKRTGTVAKEMEPGLSAIVVGLSVVLDPSAQRVFAVRLRLKRPLSVPSQAGTQSSCWP